MKKITLFIIFSFIVIIANSQCSQPSNIDFEDYSIDTIRITWDTNEESSWDIEYGESGFTPTGIPTIENVNNNSLDVSQLPSDLYLDLFIRADCGSETSDWVGPFTFYNYCTENLNTSFQVSENFQNEFLPFCFTQTNIGSPESNYFVSNESTWEQGNFANNGSLSAKVNIQGVAVDEWLILPIMTGFPGVRSIFEDKLKMNFNIALTQHNSTEAANLGSDDVVKLVLSPDNGQTWFTLQTWDASSSISNTGETIFIEYDGFSDGIDLLVEHFLVAFWATSGSINDAQNIDFYIDDISAIPPSTSSVNDLKTFNFTYYPTPSKDKITLSANELISEVAIYNQLGQQVKLVNLNAIEKEIDISTLQKGVYFMKVKINTILGTLPLIKD